MRKETKRKQDQKIENVMCKKKNPRRNNNKAKCIRKKAQKTTTLTEVAPELFLKIRFIRFKPSAEL